MNISFSKEHTLISKGIAIILMMVHHLFYDFESMQHFELFFGQREAAFWVAASGVAKVCVAVFALLSGYGMYTSYRDTDTDVWQYVYKHIKKLLVMYWWAIIPFVIIGGAITCSRPLAIVYGNGNDFYLKALLDFLGIGYIIFGFQNMYNVTCWYVGEILVIYIMFPLLLKISGYRLLKSLLLFYVVYLISRKIPYFINFYLLCFIIGMILAKYGILSRLANNMHKAKLQFSILVLLILSVGLRLIVGLKADLLLTFAIIGLALIIQREAENFAKLFKFLGIYSANIFMTHTFFYYYFFSEYIHYPRYPIFVLIVLLINCLVYSTCLEWIKDRLLYCFNYSFKRNN